MGLDNYPARAELRGRPGRSRITKEDLAAFTVAGLSVVDFDDRPRWVAIRGSIYNVIVEAATDYTLYVDWLPPGQVARLAVQLREWTPEDIVLDMAIWRGASEEERQRTLDDLRAFFDICAERGLGLEGNW